MNRTVLLATLLVITSASAALAQAAAPGGAPALPPRPSESALGAHDLEWIRSANDFDQSCLGAAAIDAEIAARVRAYDRETPIVTFEVPINSEGLRGPERATYVAHNAALGGLDISAPGGPLARDAYFWRYGNFHIAVSGDGYHDQLNVHAVARALEILRYRYPLAYERLLEQPRRFSPDPLRPGTPYRNRNAEVLFSFDESPDAIASSVVAIGPGAQRGGDTEYGNVALISIDPGTIQGSSADVGSGALYGRGAAESYARYLREGLVETLVHEMLHTYIDYRYAHDAVYAELYRYRYDLAVPDTTRTAMEEAIVASTSLHYFLREGGLQADVPFFYRGILEGNILEVDIHTRNQFAQLIRPNVITAWYKDRFRLPVLD
ncbi:MAG TPA: hypothetical protein VF006_33825 [Longimicrobium sp.]